MARRSTRSRRRTSSSRRRGSQTPVLRRTNYVLLLAGIACIVLGFTLMYMEGALEGVLSLYVGPLLLVGGYVEIIYALLWEPGTNHDASESTSPQS